MNFNFLGNSNSEVKEKKSFFQPKHPDFQSYINSYSNSAGPLLKNIPQRLTPLLDKYIYTDEEAKNQKTQPSSIQSELFSQKFCSQNKEQKGEHGKLNHIFELEVNDSEPHETGQFGFQDDTLSNTTETDYQSTFGYVKEESEVSSESSEDSEEVQNDPSFKTIDATILNTYKNKFPNHFELPKAREGNSPIENGPLFKKKEDSSSLSVVNPVLNTPKAYGTPSSLLSFQDFFKLCKSNSKNDDEIPPVSNQSSKSIDHSSSSNLVYRKQNTNTPNSTFKDYNQAMLSSSKPASVLQTPSSNSFNYNKNLISSAESTFNTPNIMTEEYEESSQSDPISEIIPKRINFDEYEGNLPVIHEENQRGITYEEDTDFESEIEGSDVEYIDSNDDLTQEIKENEKRSDIYFKTNYHEDVDISVIKKRLDEIELRNINHYGELCNFQKDIDETKGLLNFINKRMDSVFDLINDRKPDDCFLTNSELEIYLA